MDASVYGVFGAAPTKKVAAEEIQMRCSLQFVNEALRCYGDRVVRSARDADIGAILGLGFPPFRGGPLRYADTLGPAEVLRRIRGYEDRFGARWTPAPLLVDLERKGKRLYSA